MLYPEFDTATIFAISIIIDFILILILIHTWRTRTTYPGFIIWIIGTACWVVGSMLAILLNELHPHFIPKVIGNGLIMMHPLLLLEGINKFHGIRRRWWGTELNIALVLAGMLSLCYFAYISDNLAARAGGISLILAVLFARVSLEPLIHVRFHRYSIQWLLSGILLPLVVLNLARTVYYFTLSPLATVSDMLAHDYLLRWLVFYGIIVELVIAYSYLSLTSDRVEKELFQSKESYRELSSSLQEKVEEEARRRVLQERHLAHQSRLAAMGEMISAIAHQWRQPLATLGMIVQRTSAVGSMKELTPEYLAEFKAGAMRQILYMSDTIEGFRDFYRPEKEKKPFSPFSCIADSVRLFQPQFTGNGIAVAISCDESDNRLVSGFSNEFKQVMLNLLSNARDAILESRAGRGEPEEGRISVTITTATGGDNLLIIDISDNGCGISAENAARIFSPYFSTKDEKGGTGIGLYMSRMIVESSMEGHITLIKSTKGATFRIELPLEEQP
ncbi:MAG: HAMP domain-containing sensor histidine kinase [Deltaproteobacteria bacterium]